MTDHAMPVSIGELLAFTDELNEALDRGSAVTELERQALTARKNGLLRRMGTGEEAVPGFREAVEQAMPVLGQDNPDDGPPNGGQ
jgi:hypothetical protein